MYRGPSFCLERVPNKQGIKTLKTKAGVLLKYKHWAQKHYWNIKKSFTGCTAPVQQQGIKSVLKVAMPTTHMGRLFLDVSQKFPHLFCSMQQWNNLFDPVDSGCLSFSHFIKILRATLPNFGPSHLLSKQMPDAGKNSVALETRTSIQKTRNIMKGVIGRDMSYKGFII